MAQGMTTDGWLFLVLGWGFILALTVYCFSRVLFAKRPEVVVEAGGREQWGSRVGLILAVAGNAIGLGNFLRFPVKAAANGGGAFMIPYFVAFIFLGIPMMWVEWTIGRMGGAHGHGTTPGMLGLLWKKAPSKYLGALGVVIPFLIVIYYNFIESWCLGFSWFSVTGKYFGHANREAMGRFLRGFQGIESNEFFSSLAPVLVFWGITVALNFYFLYKGISKGIEVLAKYGMPLLFLFGIILVVRVLTLGTPDPAQPQLNIGAGMGFFWNPDFSRLGSATVWLTAAGQIFFTLSLGMGIIQTYASYVREKQDITLNGLTTSSVNEFAEVILGGTVAIPAAVVFFGAAETQIIANEGAFNLGFQALPVIFQKIPLGQIFGGMFFFLLFIAGITSSVAMTQPAIAFLEDEFKWKREKAVIVAFSVLTAMSAFVIAFFKFGFLDELDFWAGTFGLVVFAALEIVLFAWVFGLKKGWQEMHKGADLKVPRAFKFILTYVTPVYLLVLLGYWFYTDAIREFLMKDKAPANHPYLWGARVMIVGLLLAMCLLIRRAWNKKKGAAAAGAEAATS
ncbi:MAG TPA: sodium-dependent transporter [Candidatus Aminicenantes bacterium]|nr:sodium-dependent transporter [Candidatus Aminicenantes bacterium]